MLIVVILVAFVPVVLLTVLRLVLTVVTFVLTEFSKLLMVVILVVFVVTKLLTARTAPVLGIAVSKEPSPICLPKTDPVEIVEKNPKFVEITPALIFEALIFEAFNVLKLSIPDSFTIAYQLLLFARKLRVPNGCVIVLYPLRIVTSAPVGKIVIGN